MANLTLLNEESKVEENKSEQLNEVLDKSNDDSESEDSTSSIILILYAAVTMAIVLFLLK